MIKIQDMIVAMEERQNELKRAISIGQRAAKKLPQGRLRINNNKGVVEYYKITEKNDTRGKYLKKSNKELIRKLAQGEYLDKQLKSAKSELKEIEKIVKSLKRIKRTLYRADNVYSSMIPERQKLVAPILISEHEYVENWEKEEYKRNEYRPEEKVYSTKKGDMVRSKSEVLLADMYYELGIPYRYEAELKYSNGRTIYPDFTVLDVVNRREIYHEHMGLLDDEEYRYHNLRKIEEYRKNDIFAGKNLFITHEAGGCPLNIREIEKCIRWLLDVHV